MAALRLKEAAALVSSDQARVALLRLPLPSVSLCKPCIPPALGPRPSEAPCSPPPPSSYNYHRGSHLRNVCHVHEIEPVRLTKKSPNLQLAMGVYQWTNGISVLTRELPWFGSSNVQVKRDHKTTTPRNVINSYDCNQVHHPYSFLSQLFIENTKHTDQCHQQQPSSSSVDLVKQLYSLDESRWQLCFDAVVLQEADRLERAQEPPHTPSQDQHKQPRQSQKELERRGEPERRLPSDKATPAQMSFILLKLREELPVFFDGHHSYHIYDANMTFENNLSPQPWSSQNRQSYRMFLESSRLALKFSFSQIKLDLIKITKDVDQGKIEARWRVRGRPRYLLSLKESVLIEGFSTFLINSSGLIWLHKMDRVMPASTKEKVMNSLRVWLGNLVGVASPKSPLPQPDLANSSEHF